MIDHGKCGLFLKVEKKTFIILHKLIILVLGDMIMKGEGHTDWV